MARRERSLTVGRRDEISYEFGTRTKEAQEWIESILGSALIPSDNLEFALKNGVALCTLIKKLTPDLIKKFHDEQTTNKMKYKAIENM